MFEAKASEFSARSVRSAGGWCILRTKPSLTLKLARTLSEDGFEVWTPAETRTFRARRATAKRDVEMPILPSYVFARVDRLLDLLEIEHEEIKPRRGPRGLKPAHASFRVMRFAGRMVTIEDIELSQLRRIEQKRELARMRGQRGRAFSAGANVQVKSGVAGGSFGGMVARVKKSSAGNTRLEFEGSGIRFTFRTSLLDPNDVGRL